MESPILSVKNLSVRLKKGDKRQILSNISFDIKKNEVVTLTGFNGSGKSTILKIIEGRTSDYKIDDGSIIFEGTNILEVSDIAKQEFRSKIAYIRQEDVYDFGDVFNIEDLILDRLNRAEIKMSLKEIQQKIDDFFQKNEKSPITLKSKPNKLSGGQKRLLSIFLGIISKPNAKLFLIDEPLNNLDFENAKKVSNIINTIHLENKNATILMVTHCRIITCITRAIELKLGEIVNLNAKYECHNCYGEADECGMYH